MRNRQITFNIAEETYKELDDLKKDMNKSSRGEVIQTAIGVLKVLQKAKREGKDIGVGIDKHGKTKERLILPW